MEKALIQAYKETEYRVYVPELIITVDELHPDLDEFIIDNGAFQWAYISAHNPYSQPTTALKNVQQHQALVQEVKMHNWTYCEGVGMSKNGEWPPEISLLIVDITLEEAKKLGQQFRQNAILFGQVNKTAQLILLEKLND